ncbi:MAG: hypothetical protein ACI9QL_002171 [Candidatus Omnitrophota bacterium]|jgi:hypothetical protein
MEKRTSLMTPLDWFTLGLGLAACIYFFSMLITVAT